MMDLLQPQNALAQIEIPVEGRKAAPYRGNEVVVDT